MQQRTCPVCGNCFTPTYHSQVYCPPTAKDRRTRSQARSSCARRASNAKHRGPAQFTVPDSFSCAQCRVHCVPGTNGLPAHASRFCSRDCKAKWHRIHVEGRPSRRDKAKAKLTRAAEGKGADVPWFAHLCPECGQQHLSHRAPTADNGYCSRACQLRQKRRRRRAREITAAIEYVSLAQVALRDGWRCGICGASVPNDVTVPDPQAATLDHIHPLSLGGAHSMDNTQLAHFICNSRKRDLVAA